MRRAPKNQRSKYVNRLFLSVVPDKNIKDQARDIARELKSFSYKLYFTPLERIHLTLRYLGNDVSENSAKVIMDKIREKSFKDIKIKSTGISFGFYSQAKPQVMFLTLEENPQLEFLQNEINSLVRLEYFSDVAKRKDRKKLISHITIARVKKDISKSQTTKIRQHLDNIRFVPQESYCKEIVLLKSELGKKGPIYTPIDTVRLR